MNSKQKAYLELHIAVFLFGFTAILGKLILLEELPLVWWRLLLTCVSLILLPKVYTAVRGMSKKQILQLGGIGCLVALHWVLFFGSIKYANVSVALVCMATASFFTAFLEPLFFKTKIKWFEIVLGSVVILGMYFVVNGIQFDMMTGLFMGLISALLYSIFTVFNRKVVNDATPMSITFIELSVGWILLSLLMPFYYQITPSAPFLPVTNDWIYLSILAFLCTTLAYVLALRSLKHISAFNSNLTVNLEPVYGILMALFFFQENEELTQDFYWGVVIILLAVFVYPMLNRKNG